MAVLTTSTLDLIDLYKRQDGNKQIAKIIELLAQDNAVLDDAMFMECNKGSSHLHTIRTGLPSVQWGQLYTGIAQSKSRTQQVEDTTGFLEALSSVDKRVLDLAEGNEAALRLSETMSFLEAMNQEMATGIFYHDTATTPEKFKGLSCRFNTLTGAGAGNQVVNAGGAGSDNASIWFVSWGDQACSLLYPKGTTAGLTREDKGEQRVLDGSNNPYYVKEELFRWHVGMAVKDWRRVSRIANIDVSSMQAGSVDLFSLMRKAYWKLKTPSTSGGKVCIYMNRDVMEVLDAQSSNANSPSDNFVRLTPMEIEGKVVQSYRGIPIRICDALLNTESLVA